MGSATGTQLEPVTRPSLAVSTSASLRPIEKQAGLVNRWYAGLEASREAGRSLADVRTQQVQADARIASTAVKLGEAQIKSALVSSSLVAIGALTLDLGRKTAAIDAPLSSVYRLHIAAASITEIDWYADGPAVLRTLNETAHLRSLI